MEQTYKAVNLPKIGHEFKYDQQTFHLSIDNTGRTIVWRQYITNCELCGVYNDNIETSLIKCFSIPENLTYNDKPVFIKKIELKPGQIYICSKSKSKWLIINDSGKFNLVSIPEFYVQSGWIRLTKEDMTRQLEVAGYSLSKEQFNASI